VWRRKERAELLLAEALVKAGRHKQAIVYMDHVYSSAKYYITPDAKLAPHTRAGQALKMAQKVVQYTSSYPPTFLHTKSRLHMHAGVP
jgi:hypothetical protein